MSKTLDIKEPLVTEMAVPASDSSSSDSEEGEFSPLALAKNNGFTPLPTYKAAGTTETDFDGLLPKDRVLRLHEDLTNGCGGQLWPAGMTLARYMLRYHAKSLAGKRILELGAGGGLVGLAVARGCDLGGGENYPPLCITDQTEMFSLMRHNIALNKLEGKVEAKLLNWGEPLPAEIVSNPPDVILAADCVYFEPAFPLLQTTLSDLLSLRPEAVIYFCFKKRRRADMQFLKQARKRYRVAEVEDEEKPVWSRQGLFMFAITAKGKGMVDGKMQGGE
ncbi:putative methyltransferase-domain-containing protein [Xylaria bambusicola]|uniref:putative methyltransferase-domain-containing protein n=1 Tax=Xylaria bambusicola TaxID=326684 RepID=UPI002008CE1E|nr:putative methyltransferase-domain-containing protein [Xylaria bambusicola]KAI0522007.1 putative methyltransferase-domain-containing protein [Xylaria bambusicola]